MPEFLISIIAVVGPLALGLVALLRCERKDVPEVVKALADWWRRRS